MLNKIKKNILPMLDTLGDALTQYLAQDAPPEELHSDIIQFIDAINAPIMHESEEVIKLSRILKSSLENLQLPEIERFYNEYCTAIENLLVQYKAVFLPYYDNTWDSLASVYEAFAADNKFITEIVIIPIRRNTPHGWEVVYKDYLTPKGIPNTPFSNYSFEKDLPDFVFYNNPYDGVNVEKFQSQNIKPYTGCMVFIPYYLYRHEWLTKDQIASSAKGVSELPGHNNCDIFVTQGESFYKRYMHRSKNGMKMVVLGNPKTDHIYKSIDNWRCYPEWEKIIEGKHVFFLNTHYSSVLGNPWKFWMPNVINYIDEHEELVLIWRPHPQSFLMLSENSQTEGEAMFRRLLEMSAKSERIILDKTESAVSAMMYSEAIITDQSSIISEAIFMDKPILLMDPDVREILPEERVDEYSTPTYYEKIQNLRKYDKRKLFLRDAVCFRGVNRPLKSGENFQEYFSGTYIFEFMEDIINGIDRKKELRALYREQLFVNREGDCGQAILEHIKGLLRE